MSEVGWRSRGYVPHCDSPEVIQQITFHLADSLPKEVLTRLGELVHSLPEGEKKLEKQRQIETWLDNGHGNCCLREPALAEVIEEQLFAGDGAEYRLIEWVVMPNHVHVLAELASSTSLSRVVKQWKGASATLCNRLLGRSGTFWFPEYHDRYIRNDRHFTNAVAYIQENPVKAGLCIEPGQWRYGSARFRI